MIELFDMNLSGNCYKIRLFLNMLNVKYKLTSVDLTKNEHKSDNFLKLNPRGEIPVLIDDERIIWDSQAILVYLARKYDHSDNWLPTTPYDLGKVMQWLAVAGEDIFFTLAKARAILIFGRGDNLQQCQQAAPRILQILEQQLSRQDWLVTDHATIGDIACYPYVALAEEGDISLANYPAIHDWLARIQVLPGYISMPGITSVN